MSRHTLVVSIDGETGGIMPVVVEEIADQILRGMRSGHVSLMGGIDWSMKDVPRPVDIDMRQRRAAALLLMAVGDVPTLTAMAGSVHEATSACPGLMASDLPLPTAEGRFQALREARALIDDMLGDRP
jgi:hypothetical protein